MKKKKNGTKYKKCEDVTTRARPTITTKKTTTNKQIKHPLRQNRELNVFDEGKIRYIPTVINKTTSIYNTVNPPPINS